MTDINVDDFFKDAARALVALYGVFPRQHAIFVDDIYQPEEPDEFGLHSERYQACFGTLLWLGEEGYLRFEETIRGEAIEQAVLTGRSFTLLSSPAPEEAATEEDLLPDLLRLEHSTHIYRIKTALRDRSSMALRGAMMAFMRRMERTPD